MRRAPSIQLNMKIKSARNVFNTLMAFNNSAWTIQAFSEHRDPIWVIKNLTTKMAGRILKGMETRNVGRAKKNVFETRGKHEVGSVEINSIVNFVEHGILPFARRVKMPDRKVGAWKTGMLIFSDISLCASYLVSGKKIEIALLCLPSISKHFAPPPSRSPYITRYYTTCSLRNVVSFLPALDRELSCVTPWAPCSFLVIERDPGACSNIRSTSYFDRSLCRRACRCFIVLTAWS